MGIVKILAGALPKPAPLVRARWKHAQGETGAETVEQATEKAIEACFALQQKLGFEHPVDGQLGRGDLIDYFTDNLEGCEPLGLVRCAGNLYHRRPRIHGDVVRKSGVALPEWRRAAKIAKSDGVRAMVTGPYTLSRWSYDEHYPSAETCATAFTDAVCQEIAELAGAGVSEIQLDEPALGGHEPAWVDGLLQRCAAAAGDARLWLSCGFGVLDADLDRIWSWPAQIVVLDLAGAGADRLERLPKLGGDRILAAGIADATRPDAEPDSALIDRLGRIREKVDGDRLWLTPGSGLHSLRSVEAEARIRQLAGIDAA